MQYIYSIYDKVAQMYSPLQLQPKDGVMTRTVGDMVREGNNQIANHPEDYKVMCLGIYHEQTGEIEPEHREVCECSIFSEQAEN